jgi:hypothetical protein
MAGVGGLVVDSERKSPGKTRRLRRKAESKTIAFTAKLM